MRYGKRRKSRFLVAGLLACLLSTVYAGPDRPNVLLIMVDDLNDYTGFLGGHPQAITPHMDKLAEEGVVFSNAHSNAQICAPSRSSMFTGIYPHVSGNYWFTKWYENETLKKCTPLAQYLGDNGYLTFGTGKLMHHVRVSDWTEYGLDNYPGPFPFDGKWPAGHPSVPEPFRVLGTLDGLYASLADIPVVPATAEAPGYTGWFDHREHKPFRYVNDDDRDLMNDERQANWIISKLKELDAKEETRPLFLAVGFSRPHTPLVAPQKYFDMYPRESLTLPTIKPNDQADCHFRSVFPGWTPPWMSHYESLVASYENLEDGLRAHLQAYLACITFADDQVGKVMDALRSSRYNDNTIVVLASDHGYHQGEKQFLYKNSLWEESTRVPLIFRVPGNTAAAVDRPVSLIDVYPTLADLCGLSGRNTMLNGHSMKPLIDDPELGEWDGPDVALSVVRSPTDDFDPAKHNFAVRSKTHRYIRYANGSEELYDHRNDEFEWTNLADNPEHAEIKAQLKQEMENLLQGSSPATQP